MKRAVLSRAALALAAVALGPLWPRSAEASVSRGVSFKARSLAQASLPQMQTSAEDALVKAARAGECEVLCELAASVDVAPLGYVSWRRPPLAVKFLYDDTSLLAEYDTNGIEVAKYDYGGDRLIRLTRADEGTRYMTFDGLGSVTGLTDATGAVTATYHLDAWGNYRFTSELTTSHNRFGFTGHYWDKEASLYYAKARFYDPFTARFTQADSFLGTIDDPPSLHRYFYANDNPTMYTDPTGHVSEKELREIARQFKTTTDAAGRVGGRVALGGGVIAGSVVAAPFVGIAGGTAVATGAGFGFGYGNARIDGASHDEGVDAGLITGLQSAVAAPFAYAGGVVGAGMSRLGGLSERATSVIGSAVGGFTGDLAAQAAAIGVGIQEKYNAFQGLMNATVGGILGSRQGRGPQATTITEVAETRSLVATRASNTTNGYIGPERQLFASTRARLPQDVAVNPNAPPALPLNRRIGTSPAQDAELRRDVAAAQAEGATDIRVNQQQLDAAGNRVGIGRPDLSLVRPDKVRKHIEYDTPSSGRGVPHANRLLANDPHCVVECKTIK